MLRMEFSILGFRALRFYSSFWGIRKTSLPPIPNLLISGIFSENHQYRGFLPPKIAYLHIPFPPLRVTLPFIGFPQAKYQEEAPPPPSSTIFSTPFPEERPPTFPASRMFQSFFYPRTVSGHPPLGMTNFFPFPQQGWIGDASPSSLS